MLEEEIATLKGRHHRIDSVKNLDAAVTALDDLKKNIDTTTDTMAHNLIDSEEFIEEHNR
jgi:hypothetical protein